MASKVAEVNSPLIAALPMYDFPALLGTHDSLWSRLKRHFEQAGVADVPVGLTRNTDHEKIWTDPHLLFGQACEFPLAKYFPQRTRHVATPRYSAPGCQGGTYRSALLVRGDDPATRIVDLRGRRCVINELHSNSGMNLLRAAIAPIAGGPKFFGSLWVSSSHRQSVQAVAAGEADVCAVDCVTKAHLQRLYPSEGIGSLRILDWTVATPSLPLITAATVSDATLANIRTALHALTQDPAFDEFRDVLFLDGFDLAPVSEYSAALHLEREASRWGYPDLN
jgi:ABC-type phosphate/phosphonate transport system substrate-binding protein